MKILKSKFYPVDMFNYKIYDEPKHRAADVESDYGPTHIIPIKGKRIAEHDCYREKFEVLPPLTKPVKCPECHSKNIDPEYVVMYGPHDDFDHELAEKCQPDVDWDSASMEAMSPYLYVYDTANCDDCNHNWAWGPRWYWNKANGDYTAKRPQTPVEKSRALLIRREREGQITLPGIAPLHA